MGLARFFRWFGLPGPLVLTALLSLFALTLAGLFPSLPRWLCAAGMLCSSLGDILLMNYRPITNRLPFRGFAAGAGSLHAGARLVYDGFSHCRRAAGGAYLLPRLVPGARPVRRHAGAASLSLPPKF